ncbi:hypothetical protein HPB47_001490 [Ixodes persulcatus]|uniref:Uncharacterized protein n=2 Tax=Ixodes TaxID=6944 RepID=A0AC60PNW5_IXOPE|nr:hypothetical protein HPB47_001490 [Ixodes persulcatus]
MEEDSTAAGTSKSPTVSDGDCSGESSKKDDADSKESGNGAEHLKSSVLTEVLNKKKMALLHSPEVVRFLQDQQRKKLKPNSAENT